MGRHLLALAWIFTAAQATELWAIGSIDGSCAEFALAPGRYSDWQRDGAWRVGQSQAADWPCLLPGPRDTWAGSRSHTYSVVFALLPDGRAGAGELRLAVLDSQRPSGSQLAVSINGHVTNHALPAGGGDQALTGDLSAARPTDLRVPIPRDWLREGGNTVQITSLDGSWILFDGLTFSADGWQLGTEAPLAALRARALPRLRRTAGGLQQAVSVETVWFGTQPTTASLLVDNTVTTDLLLDSAAPPTEIEVPLARSRQQRALSLRTLTGETVATTVLEQPAVKPMTIYILPHSHVDIGYTARQADVVTRQVANLQRALELAEQTADYPVGSQFKWNTEVHWGLDHWLAQAGPDDRQRLLRAMADHRLEVDALYGNILTGLCRPEELLQATTFASRIGAEAGVPVRSAMISDVPGYTWGTLTALAEAGVRYWSIGPNPGDRIGHTLAAWQNKPFYWRTPDGRARVLVWVPQAGYAIGHWWGRLTPHLDEYMATLEGNDYPYDITYLRWNVGGDNGPPDEHLADDVKAWNEQYASPKLVISTVSEAFSAFEQRYGAGLPEVAGEWTPYWEDGAGSSAAETALNRNSAETVVQALALLGSLPGGGFAPQGLDDVWRDILLYSEHTWGAHNSIAQPDEPFVRDQWQVKQAFALDGARGAQRLLDTALASYGAVVPGAIDVFNTSNWPRTDLVLVPADLALGADRVLDEAGQPLPSQRLRNGQLAVLVADVPAFGRRRLNLEAGPASGGEAMIDGTTLRTASLSATLDSATGELTSLKTADGAEWVDAAAQEGLGSYRYLLGSDLSGLEANGPVRISIGEPGPLVVSLIAESSAPGARLLRREVRLLDGLDRADLQIDVDKVAVREKEGLHLGFPLHVPDGQLRFDTPLAVIRPELDQIPGSCKNWLTVGRWLDISNAERGLTLTTLDAPLFEVGGITANLIGSLNDPSVWSDRIEPSQKLYCWALNNHWHTNYRADQEGRLTYRFGLRPHAAWSQLQAQRFGLEQSQPLIVAPARGEVTRPSLTVEPDKALVSLLKPAADGNGLIVRLWAGAGEAVRAKLTFASPRPTAIYRSDLAETRGEPVTWPVEVPAMGLVTLRAEWR